jgi:hypothetical protein
MSGRRERIGTHPSVKKAERFFDVIPALSRDQPVRGLRSRLEAGMTA